MGLLELGDCADAGQQERGQAGIADAVRGGLDPLPVGVAARAVVNAPASKAVAVRDLDRVDSGGVQRGDDSPHPLGGDPVPEGVHAIAQGHVLDEQVLAAGHAETTCSFVRAAICSATCTAAEVMMSRLPAYAGR